MDLNRRQFMELAGAGAIATLLNPLPNGAEAQPGRFEFLSSPLTEDRLREQRDAAIDSLARSIPTHASLQYLRDFVPNLRHESQMHIPDDAELRDVVRKSEAELDELAQKTAVGEHGIFIFADVDGQGNRNQRMYVLKRISRTRVQFVKRYLVSTAQNGFGFGEDEEQTPLGLHTVHGGDVGRFGEVVSSFSRFADPREIYERFHSAFNRVKVGNKDRWFARGFDHRQGNRPEVVTDQYLLQGPRTGAQRGIRIHGTNFSGEMTSSGWRTFLGGRSRSGGCIRMSNTDVRDLSVSGYIKTGTAVMIHATPLALSTAQEPSPEDISSRPPSWRTLTEQELRKVEDTARKQFEGK